MASKHRKKTQQNSLSARDVFVQLCGQVHAMYRYFLFAYVIALVSAQYQPRWEEYVYWPAFHGATILLGALTLAYVWRDKTWSDARYVADGIGRIVRRQFTRTPEAQAAGEASGAVKHLASIAVLLGAAAIGSDVLSLLVIAFGLGVVVYGRIPERAPFIATVALWVALAVALQFKNKGIAEQLAITSFECLLIIGALLVRQTVSRQNA